MLGLLKMCYTCLGADSKELIDMSDTDFDSVTFLYKLKACVSPQLEEYNSKQMCLTCIKWLRISYRFREMVLLTQQALSKHRDEIISGTYVVQSKLTEFQMELDRDMIKTDCVYLKQEVPSMRTRSARQRIKKINLHLDIDETSSRDNDNGSDSDYFLSELRPDENKLNEEDKIETLDPELKSDDDINVEDCDIMDTKAGAIKNDCKGIRKSRRGRPKKRIKDSNPDLNYECFHCSMVFNKRWKLQKHITRVHNDSKKYVCTYCNKGFKQSYHLREHLTSHTGERNYTCSFCDKSFQRISSMRRHIRSHEAAPGQKTKRTPFLCTVCGKSFPFSNGVQRHMRIHLGIRNHECTICQRRFTQSTHLHVHMRTHTGEKPYICDTCGEAFSLNASLQKHMAIHQSRNNLVLIKSQEC